jgi:competence protein ComGC
MNRQKGFTLVEGLLIVLTISVIVLTSLFVVNMNKESSQTNTENTTSDEVEVVSEENAPRSASWKLVESGQDGFSVNIPDGWEVVNAMDSNWIIAGEADNTVYQEGVSAVVEETESFGTDEPLRFNLTRFDDDNFIFLDGDEQNLGEFSAKNAKGTKYYKEYPNEMGDGIGPLPGQITYTYMFEVGDSTTFVIYNQQIGEPDILDIVEELIATLTIN